MDARTEGETLLQHDRGTASMNGPTLVTAPRAARAPRKRRSRRLLVGAVVAVAGLAALWAAGAGRVSWVGRLFGSSANTFARTKASRVSLAVTVVSRGELASSKNIEVANEVEGQTTLIRILPEGARVRKGDIVCELDSSMLRDNLANQAITTSSAKAQLDSARTTREVAEIAVKEYLEGTYLQSVQAARSDMVLAESELARATDRYQWTERMVAIKYVSDSQKLTDAQTKMKAKMDIDRAVTSMRVLQHYTGRKKAISLEAEVQKARVGELAQQAIYERELAKQKKLEGQITKCLMRAPDDGMVVYAKDPNPRPGATAPTIMEGATIRERQRIFTLPDVSRMRVDAKVSEADIAKVVVGQRARVRVDGLPGEAMLGIVSLVQMLPDSAGGMDTGVKVYTVRISIDYPPAGLMPGMSAQVEVLVDRVDDALVVPMRTIVRSLGKDCVLVATAEGTTLREIKIGTSNYRLVEVVEGLREGEEVALAPEILLDKDK